MEHQAKPQKPLWITLLASFLLFTTTPTKGQNDPYDIPSWHPTWYNPNHGVVNSANRRNIQIHVLQTEIYNLSRFINEIESRAKFKRFNAYGLTQYRIWRQNIYTRRSQLQWQLSNLMNNRQR